MWHNLGHFSGGLCSQSLDWYWQTHHMYSLLSLTMPLLIDSLSASVCAQWYWLALYQCRSCFHFSTIRPLSQCYSTPGQFAAGLWKITLIVRDESFFHAGNCSHITNNRVNTADLIIPNFSDYFTAVINGTVRQLYYCVLWDKHTATIETGVFQLQVWSCGTAFQLICNKMILAFYDSNGY